MPTLKNQPAKLTSHLAKGVRDSVKKIEVEIKNIVEMKCANLYDQVQLLVDQVQRVEDTIAAVEDYKQRAEVQLEHNMDFNTNDIIELNVGGMHF